MTETFLKSGRNTLIHKKRSREMLICNRSTDPVVKVTHSSIEVYNGTIPATKREANRLGVERVNLDSSEVFGDYRLLLFVQTIKGQEYKIDYSHRDDDQFISLHLDTIL